MKKVDIYTDGACSGNPGKGGWCAILMCGDSEKIVAGGDPNTTNNRMELYAAIAGLSALKEPCEVRLFSDSAYLVNAVTERWLENWQRRRWRTSDNGAVKNQDLWRQMCELLSVHAVSFIKVKGHADNEYNNRCDKYAREQISLL